VMIVGRGGGSLEDLWPFNEEAVARAVYASAVPVVSAVGHETDFSISDFVADARAPTPSAAAERVVPDRREVLRSVEAWRARLGRGLAHRVLRLRDALALYAQNRYFRFPQELVLGRVQRVEDLAQRLAATARERAGRLRLRLAQASAGLAAHAPRAAVEAAAGRLGLLRVRLASAQGLRRERWAARLDRLAGRLEDLGPDRVLSRGYSRTVLERTGRTLTRAADAAAGDLLRTHLAQGSLRSRVTEAETAAGPPGRRGAAGRRADDGPTLFGPA